MATTKMVSPKAKCKWVNVKRPHPEYDNYQINLLLPAKSKQAKEWMAQIDGWIADEVKSSGKKASEFIPYKEDGDDIIFKFKQKSSIKGRNGESRDVKIMVVDSQMKPCNVDIGWGSTVKVSYSPVPYTVNGKSGVTMYFNAVQVIELIEYEGSETSGFSQEEGFISEEPSENPFVTTEEAADSDNEEDF
tara:strand:- start:1732 stop:2301 length:570 start_codon:yes stop_codon:yes gene_type:complete